MQEDIFCLLHLIDYVVKRNLDIALGEKTVYSFTRQTRLSDLSFYTSYYLSFDKIFSIRYILVRFSQASCHVCEENVIISLYNLFGLGIAR